MQITQFNKILKEALLQLVNNGYAKSLIGKLLLGSSGSAAVMSGFSSPEGFSFGIKPLTRIGKLLDKEVHIVFIDADEGENSEILAQINEANIKFINQLTDTVTEYMQKIEEQKEEYSHTRSDTFQQKKIDKLLQFLE